MLIQAIHICWDWLIQHPLGMATTVYTTSVVAVLVHAYFEAKMAPDQPVSNLAKPSLKGAI